MKVACQLYAMPDVHTCTWYVQLLQLSLNESCLCRSIPRSEACQMSCTAYGADLRLMGGRQKFAPAHILGLVRTRSAVSLYQTAPNVGNGLVSSVVTV